MMQRFVALVLMLGAVLAAPALAGQPAAPGGNAAPGVDPDAICFVGVSAVLAGPGSDPAFMGNEHDAAVATMRVGMAHFIGRMTLRYEGPALQAAIVAAHRARPANRWLTEGGRCLVEFERVGPAFATELERALVGAGVPMDRPMERTPADAATLDPDLACIAVILDQERRVEQAGASAPAGQAAGLVRGRAFFIARAMARLPAETRGAQLAMTLRSLRDDQLEQVYDRCRARLGAELARVSTAAQAALAEAGTRP